MISDCLFVIPARGGSKGIPGKNVRLLNGKPLIHYSIEYARQFTADEHICLTTDSEEIVACASVLDFAAPFIRPAALATDNAGSFEVIKHAYDYYKGIGRHYHAIVLLQPTSPIRTQRHFHEALKLYTDHVDMVVSVRVSKANPYYNLFEENSDGFLELSKGEQQYHRRQDVPNVYEYNGSIYIINPRSLENKTSFKMFDRNVKYIMEDKYSIDIDTEEDWAYTEFLIGRNKI